MVFGERLLSCAKPMLMRVPLHCPSADAKTTHWLYAHRWIAGAAVTSDHAIVAPVRAAQLDLKFDDGLATTGRIRTDTLGT